MSMAFNTKKTNIKNLKIELPKNYFQTIETEPDRNCFSNSCPNFLRILKNIIYFPEIVYIIIHTLIKIILLMVRIFRSK